MHTADTISLVGMPGSGKSTIGRLLAERTGLRFVDSDECIERRAGASLQEIVDSQGFMALRRLDEQVILELPLQGCVVATGGSVVYSQQALQRLRAAGPIIWLQVPLEALLARIAAAPPRGIANPPDMPLERVLAEREPLCLAAADLSVRAAGNTPAEVVEEILAWLDASRTRPQP